MFSHGFIISWLLHGFQYHKMTKHFAISGFELQHKVQTAEHKRHGGCVELEHTVTCALSEK